ncbi:MAG: acyl-CoA thioesterase [Pseudomonadota bacterium]
MNLFLRLMLLFIRAQFSSKKEALVKPYKLTFRVWLTDQDMFMHMTNSRYLSFSDLGTINFIIRSGSMKQLNKNGWYPVICGQTMSVSRMLKTPQAFVVTSQIMGWTEKYVGIRHTFERKGKVHAEVNVIARFASRDRKPVTPQQMVDAVNWTGETPELPELYLDLIDRVEAGRAEISKS